MALVFDENLKVITVEKPQTTLTIQTLYNEIRLYEEKMPFLFVAQIANGSGKQGLGGGVTVGITLELINDWRLSFQARDGIEEGGGTILCTVSGGNLVATNQYSNNPIKPTANTQVVISQSSSATITKAESDTTLLYLMENLIGTHRGSGSYYYWDPTSGSDSNDGTSPTKAVLTFSKAQTLATDGKYDTIICISGGTDGITTVTETLTITKDGLKIRGAGYPFQLKPTSTTVDTVTINATNIEISGLYISTATTGTRDGVVVNGNHNIINDCWITAVRGHGIKIASSARTRINTSVIEKCGQSGTGNGINIGNTVTQSLISKCIISDNVNGVVLSGTGIADNIFENNLVYNHTAYGIDIGSGVLRTGVRSGHTFAKNTSGNTRDLGTDTFIESAGAVSAQNIIDIVDAVWDEVITSGHAITGSAAKVLKDTKTRATLASLK